MLTRCSAPTFMEMHPLIYPGSACSRLCLTSVLREVYYPSPLFSSLPRPYRSRFPFPFLRSFSRDFVTRLLPLRPYPPLAFPRLSSHRYFSQLHLRCESRLKIIRIRFSIRIGRAASRRPDYDFAKSMKGKREKGIGKPQARNPRFTKQKSLQRRDLS